MDPIDHFISHLYCSTQHIELAQFRKWALNELQTLIDFDAAIWSTGHLSTRTFHTHTTLGLPQDFADQLIAYLPINPISKLLFTRVGEPVDMSDVLNDDAFFNSDIYKSVFKPQKITRILSSVHIEQRSGIYTLLTLYRKNTDNPFTQEDKEIYGRALFHLLKSASQACILNLKIIDREKVNHTAICDKHGIYHETEIIFLDLMEEYFPDYSGQSLPFSIPLDETNFVKNQLHIHCEKMGDLYRITARPTTPLDELTQRELEVVNGVSQGMSFKQIAKKLSLSPSTISNHLYRIYQKLHISNRTELADLMHDQIDRT
jgi:DNA-binding CsgD family transcriptional regulator